MSMFAVRPVRLCCLGLRGFMVLLSAGERAGSCFNTITMSAAFPQEHAGVDRGGAARDRA